MKRIRCSRILPRAILAIMLILLAGIGCAPTIRETLPKMRPEQVTLKVKLDPKPYLPLTDDQVTKLLKFDPVITKTIFDNQADWFAIYDEALAIQKGYEDYLADLFSGQEKKK